jgi:hypothetical protein
MTQDQWGQPVNPGYVVRGEVVPDDGPGSPPAGQGPPMTQFQKVASRADQPGQPTGEDTDETRAEEDRAVSSPGRGDYWDDDEDALEDEPAEDLAAGPAEGAAASADAAASAVPDAGPQAPAGQAEEQAGEAEEQPGEAEEQAGAASPDGHAATGPSMTQPSVFGEARPAAATVATVPIVLPAEPAGGGGQPAEPAAAAADAELRPGESGTTLGLGESGYASLITDSADLRAQWHQIQYTFVDDPRGSVTQAADAITQVATRLEAAITERQRGLRARWDTTGAVDTETLRETLRMYRSFLDQLLGPEPS